MLISSKPIMQGQIFATIRNFRLVDRPSFQTIQITARAHIEEHSVLSHLNHSCDPNVFVDTLEMNCRALRPIPAGTELNFFYPSTEWELARPFVCLCGARRCIGYIRGARYLSDEALAGRMVGLHILELLRERHETFASGQTQIPILQSS